MATASGSKPPDTGEEKKGCKVSMIQTYASFAAASYHILIGISLSYSAILLPQMAADYQASNGTSSIKLDKEGASWIASVLTIVTVPGALLAAVLIDLVGRLNLVRLATIPMCIGWVVIALSQEFLGLIVGRILTGMPGPCATSASAAYITEIASPHLRGMLVSFNSLCVSLGMLLGYAGGTFMHWRLVAWICAICSFIPVVLLLRVPESAPYLLMKGHDEKAAQSTAWLNRYQDPGFNEKQFNDARDRIHLSKQESALKPGNKCTRTLRRLASPACYKPLLVVVGLFFFQHFAGIYITLFYAVSFVQEVVTNVDPFVASVYIGIARFSTSLVNLYLFRHCKRRHMLYCSTLGMCITMAISGTFTKWIRNGETTLNWVPVLMISFYVVFSMIGLLALPFVFAAELFPLAVRGAAQSVTLSLSNVMMFTALKTYFNLKDFFGGTVGLQYYFSVMSFIAFIYSFIFVPESHKRTLAEIQEYFLHYSMYISVMFKKKEST